MSQASASSQPPPSAYPDTAAISGVRMAASRGQKAADGASSMSWKSRSAMFLMSAPAANHSSLPAITMQRTSGSASQPSSAAASSSISSGDSALRASGRLSVASPTAPWVSVRMVAIRPSRSRP